MRAVRTMPPVIGEAISEAVGQSRRLDPVLPRNGGPAGNASLTAWTGLLLLALSLAELITLIDVRGLIGWHIVIGTLLVPPALLKTASTGWRMVRYYRGDAPYAAAGPPPLVLRLLGPAVVGSTLALLASGLALVLLGPVGSRGVLVDAAGVRVDWVTLHQVAFVAWAVVTGIHLLGRFVPALRLTLVRPSPSVQVPGPGRRVVVLVMTVLVSILASSLVLAAAGSWQSAGRR